MSNIKNPMENALDIKNLSVEFRTDDGVVHAINDLNLKIKKGTALGLVGETGAGKTTTGLSVLRLIPNPPGKIVAGSITLFNEDIMQKSEKDMQKIRGKEVAMIFQDPMTSLNPIKTVEYQIAEAIRKHERLGKKEAIEKARDMLDLVGIPRERGIEYPHQFSGGMKQRVVIAMALSCTPQLLIADEPTTALDVTIQAQVLDMMKRLRSEYDMSLLMITHDLGIVADICDEVSIMYAGRVVEHGTLEDIYNNPKHPYTVGLFNSLPNMDDRSARLKPIKGLMPNPMDLPSGCLFNPRCDHATELCRRERPEEIYFNSEHYACCHLYKESAKKEE